MYTGHHTCWWPGDVSNQSISRYIDPDKFVLSIPCRSLKIDSCGAYLYPQHDSLIIKRDRKKVESDFFSFINRSAHICMIVVYRTDMLCHEQLCKSSQRDANKKTFCAQIINICNYNGIAIFYSVRQTSKKTEYVSMPLVKIQFSTHTCVCVCVIYVCTYVCVCVFTKYFPLSTITMWEVLDEWYMELKKLKFPRSAQCP